MAWNIRLLRRPQARPLPSTELSTPTPPTEISPATLEQLLAIFLRLAAILQLTAHIAVRLEKFDHHAALARNWRFSRPACRPARTASRLQRL
jgi:hypothetical protein